MGETYGMLPTDVLDQRPGRFWMNLDILAATAAFKQSVREGGSQRASEAELQQLDAEQTERAERADELGERQDVGAQLAAIEEGL